MQRLEFAAQAAPRTHHAPTHDSTIVAAAVAAPPSPVTPPHPPTAPVHGYGVHGGSSDNANYDDALDPALRKVRAERVMPRIGENTAITKRLQTVAFQPDTCGLGSDDCKFVGANEEGRVRQWAAA